MHTTSLLLLLPLLPLLHQMTCIVHVIFCIHACDVSVGDVAALNNIQPACTQSACFPCTLSLTPLLVAAALSLLCPLQHSSHKPDPGCNIASLCIRCHEHPMHMRHAALVLVAHLVAMNTYNVGCWAAKHLPFSLGSTGNSHRVNLQCSWYYDQPKVSRYQST